MLTKPINFIVPAKNKDKKSCHFVFLSLFCFQLEMPLYSFFYFHLGYAEESLLSDYKELDNENEHLKQEMQALLKSKNFLIQQNNEFTHRIKAFLEENLQNTP